MDTFKGVWTLANPPLLSVDLDTEGGGFGTAGRWWGGEAELSAGTPPGLRLSTCGACACKSGEPAKLGLTTVDDWSEGA
jgi:hypothetical protein